MIGWVMIGSAAVSAGASLSSVAAPSMRVGDKWVFDQTQTRGTQGYGQQRLDLVIERVGGDTMLLGIKPDGAPTAYQDHEIGSDWSNRRILNGEDAVTTRPYAFPLHVGQTWAIDYTDPTRRGMQTTIHVRRTYKVVGWEDVTVPAGTFHALKIDSSGVDQAVFEVPAQVSSGMAAVPGQSATTIRSQAGGTKPVVNRYHSEFYYVPAVKTAVKSLEEHFNSDEVLLTRSTRVMVSFQPGG